MNKTITGSELVLWNYWNYLYRDVDDPYDSEKVINSNILPFNPSKIEFNEQYANKNY